MRRPEQATLVAKWRLPLSWFVYMEKYWTGASTKHRLVTHIVCCPKYRRRVLVGELAKRLEELIVECALVNKWEIHELSVQKDHIHLLIQTRPRESIARVVQMIKDGSSKVIRREFPKLREFLWGRSFWGDGYFAESIGTKNESLMRAYIRNQNKSWRRSKSTAF